MKVYGRLATVLLAFALLTAAAPTASALVIHNRHGHFFGVALHRGVKPAAMPEALGGGRVSARAASTPSTSGNDPTLTYQGGAVLHSSAPYLIFWTPSYERIDPTWQGLMERYFSDVASASGTSTNVYGVSRQYTDGAGFADYRQTFNPASQVITDTTGYPSVDSTSCGSANTSYARCITDAQLEGEIANLVAAHGLPNDGPTSKPEPSANAPIYFVVLPPDVDVCMSDGSGECASTYFCAYHSTFVDGSNNLLYAAIPTVALDNLPDAKSCQADGNSNTVEQPNGNYGDVALKYISHEDSETITDPLLNGWYDSTGRPRTNNYYGNENGDNCNDVNTNSNAFLPTLGGSASAGTLYNQLINRNEYYLQSEWSNGDGGCEMQPTSGSLIPQFSAPSGPDPAGQALSFNPSASSSTNSLTSATWDWGDGSSSFSASSPLGSVSHTYGTAGTYTVTLTLTDNRGNAAETSQQVTVTSAPSAAFTIDPTAASVGQSVSFTASGTSISSYSWNFGDGSAAGTGATTTHTYTAAGTYTVKLTVTGDNGGTATATKTLTVGPVAAFTATPGQPQDGQAVAFDGSGSSSPAGGGIQDYTWDFGDGSGATGRTATHAYVNPGSYTAKLTVTDSTGSNTTSKVLTVADAPPTAEFSFSPATGTTGQDVQFDGSRSAPSDPNASISSYSWNFGDGATGAGEAIGHSFGAAGTYIVRLTVTDSYGASTTVSQAVTVQAPATTSTTTPPADEPPAAAIAVRTAQPVNGSAVAFSGAGSSDPDGSIVSYRWSFGDGATATGTSPSHTYARAGTYSVSLTVTDSAGQSTTAVRSLAVAAAGRITKVKISPSRKGATIAVTVSSAGTLTAGRRVFHLRRAATVKLVITLTTAELHTVAVKHQLKLRIPLRFAPRLGPLARTSAVIAFRPARTSGHVAAAASR